MNYSQVNNPHGYLWSSAKTHIWGGAFGLKRTPCGYFFIATARLQPDRWSSVAIEEQQHKPGFPFWSWPKVTDKDHIIASYMETCIASFATLILFSLNLPILHKDLVLFCFTQMK